MCHTHSARVRLRKAGTENHSVKRHRPFHQARIAFLSVTICSLIRMSASADSLWNGTTSLWSTSGNWLPGIPSSSENAVFGNVGLSTIDLNGDQTVGGLHFDGDVINYTIKNNTLTVGSNGIRVLGNGLVNLTE